ncbi:MAG: polysaccharide biosynthesis protein [Desulfuromonadales bacterium]|nr:MAG: polysaccharide biosynthesis protein [Desulfuromonadales bacterium]
MNINTVILAWCPNFLFSTLERIKNSKLGYRFAKGMFWSLAGSLISKGLGLFSSILVARMMGKAGFGELGVIQNTVGMFGTFAGFGLGLTATKFMAEYRVADPVRAGRIRGLSSAFAWLTSSLTASLLFVFAPWLAEHTLAAPHLADHLRICSLLLFLSSINGAQTGALSGLEAFKTVARINLWSGLANFPLMVGGVYIAGLSGAVWGMVAAAGVNWLLNHIAIRRECGAAGVPYTYKSCWEERGVLWRFSLPSVLGGVLIGPVMWAANALLVNQPNGYAEMGVYNAVMRIKQVPELVLGMVMAPLLPILSEQFGSRSHGQYNKTLKYAFTLSLLVLVPVSLIQIAVPDITLMPYGKEFNGNRQVVQWLMIHSIIAGLFYPFGTIIASMNKMWFGWGYNLLWSALYISCSYLLIHARGAEGLCIAFSIAHLVSCLLVFVYIRCNNPEYLQELPFMRLAAITILAALTSYALYKSMTPIIAGSITTIMIAIYVIYIKIWLFNSSELRTESDYGIINQ